MPIADFLCSHFRWRSTLLLLVIWLVTSGSAEQALPPGSNPNQNLARSQGSPAQLKLPANPAAEDFFRAGLFEEPLVAIGGAPSGVENAALAAALSAYSKRTSPDDFSSLIGFLDQHPNSA